MLSCCRSVSSANLLARQFVHASSWQLLSAQSLSTEKLSANQYDDLYADRWAKFQCELEFEVEILAMASIFLRLPHGKALKCLAVHSRFALSTSLLSSTASRWRVAHEREFHTICTQNSSVPTLFIFFLYTAKKLPKNVNIKGVFAANELVLDEVSIYGFDYDYTCVQMKFRG